MTSLRIPAALIALSLVAPPAWAATDALEFIEVTYHCERGVTLPTVYVNFADQPGYAVALIEGRLTVLEQVISASGARYRQPDADEGYELWGKGDTARLGYGTDADTRPLLLECAVAPVDDPQ